MDMNKDLKMMILSLKGDRGQEQGGEVVILHRCGNVNVKIFFSMELYSVAKVISLEVESLEIIESLD